MARQISLMEFKVLLEFCGKVCLNLWIATPFLWKRLAMTADCVKILQKQNLLAKANKKAFYFCIMAKSA